MQIGCLDICHNGQHEAYRVQQLRLSFQVCNKIFGSLGDGDILVAVFHRFLDGVFKFLEDLIGLIEYFISQFSLILMEILFRIKISWDGLPVQLLDHLGDLVFLFVWRMHEACTKMDRDTLILFCVDPASDSVSAFEDEVLDAFLGEVH